MFIVVSCRNEFSHARLGMAIAKRYVPLSVERNRVRRIIRESFRHYQADLKAVDIVVFTQKALHQQSNTCLQEDLNDQWQTLLTSQKHSY